MIHYQPALLFGAAAIATAFVLAACAGDAIINNGYTSISYTPTEWRGQGVVPVVVRGNPFGVPQDQFDRQVADALQGSTFGVDTPFVPASQGSTPAYRVIMDFTGSGGGDSLCATRPSSPSAPPSTTQPPARVDLSTALCRGNEAITWANGSVGTMGGPSGSDFRSGVSQFGLRLFPPSNQFGPSPP